MVFPFLLSVLPLALLKFSTSSENLRSKHKSSQNHPALSVEVVRVRSEVRALSVEVVRVRSEVRATIVKQPFILTTESVE